MARSVCERADLCPFSKGGGEQSERGISWRRCLFTSGDRPLFQNMNFLK